MSEELWLPLVDEPIGDAVAQIQAADPGLAELVTSPRRQLAFRTFAYLRVGLLLGEILMDDEGTGPGDPGAWVEGLLARPEVHARVVETVQEVARSVREDPALADDDAVPDEAARARFVEFARRSLPA